MADKKGNALKRLAKKLSALRATLSKDERVLLDQIVLGTADVKGHRLMKDQERGKALPAKKALGKNKAAPKRALAAEVQAHRLTSDAAMAAANPKMANKASEIALHKMTSDAAMAAASPKMANKASEIALHQMNPGAATAANTANAANAAFQAASTGLLQFDANSGGYRVIDAAV